MTLVEFCQRLIQADSTPGKEREAIELAAHEMETLEYDDVTIDAYGNLIGRVGTGDGPTLVIDGHIDTIPLADEALWSHRPLGGEIHDNHIYGLGTSDMKGPVAALIHGGGMLKRSGVHLNGTAYFVASIAEEMTEGATLRESFEGRPIDWCVIAEPTSLDLATCQRGRAKVAIEFHGESCHAANAWRGDNAVDHAVDTALKLRSVDPGSHPLLGKRDINLIDIHSEPYPSISTIPNWCLARWDVRFLPGETKDGLLELFRACVPDAVRADVGYHRASWMTYVGRAYDVDDYAAAWETTRDHHVVKAAQGATGASLSTYQFCTNGSYFCGERGVPTVGYGPAHPDAPHTVDERIPIDQLTRAATGYRDIALALLGG
jgi:putative selenium metabolism hydrolase